MSCVSASMPVMPHPTRSLWPIATPDRDEVWLNRRAAGEKRRRADAADRVSNHVAHARPTDLVDSVAAAGDRLGPVQQIDRRPEIRLPFRQHELFRRLLAC